MMTVHHAALVCFNLSRSTYQTSRIVCLRHRRCQLQRFELPLGFSRRSLVWRLVIRHLMSYHQWCHCRPHNPKLVAAEKLVCVAVAVVLRLVWYWQLDFLFPVDSSFVWMEIVTIWSRVSGIFSTSTFKRLKVGLCGTSVRALRFWRNFQNGCANVCFHLGEVSASHYLFLEV